MTASHGRTRRPGMFSPFLGRLAQQTESNIEVAKKGNFSISVPCLDPNVLFGEYRGDLQHASAHLVTGSSEHYAPADEFHKHSMVSDADFLRHCLHDKELNGVTHTQVAEQLFSQMDENSCFLTVMESENHMFMLRLMIHLYNEKHHYDLRQRVMVFPRPGESLTCPTGQLRVSGVL